MEHTLVFTGYIRWMVESICLLSLQRFVKERKRCAGFITQNESIIAKLTAAQSLFHLDNLVYIIIIEIKIGVITKP